MKTTFSIFLALFLVAQLIRPTQEDYKYDKTLALKTTPKVEKIFKKACYDCHSDNIRYPWYSQIAPLSWIISSHIKTGRKAVNFSRWEDIPKDIKKKRLDRAVKTVYINMMPLPSYIWLHGDAVLTKDEKKILDEYFKKLLETL